MHIQMWEGGGPLLGTRINEILIIETLIKGFQSFIYYNNNKLQFNLKVRHHLRTPHVSGI